MNRGRLNAMLAQGKISPADAADLVIQERAQKRRKLSLSRPLSSVVTLVLVLVASVFGIKYERA